MGGRWSRLRQRSSCSPPAPLPCTGCRRRVVRPPNAGAFRTFRFLTITKYCMNANHPSLPVRWQAPAERAMGRGAARNAASSRASKHGPKLGQPALRHHRSAKVEAKTLYERLYCARGEMENQHQGAAAGPLPAPGLVSADPHRKRRRLVQRNAGAPRLCRIGAHGRKSMLRIRPRRR